MKQESIDKFINFGVGLSYLRLIRQDFPIHREGYVLSTIKEFLEDINVLDLKITKKSRSFSDLIEFQSELEKQKEDSLLNKDDAKKLFNIMDKLKELIYAETSLYQAYLLTDKRISVEKLTTDIGSLFAKGIFSLLPASIQYDMMECGKCIAFECCTAGAFHILRGIEGLLKLLLQNIDPNVNFQNISGWNDIIKEIKKHNIIDLEPLCDICDRIRVNYRNPTNHPEVIYNIEGVQDLFNLCETVINDIVGYMKQNKMI